MIRGVKRTVLEMKIEQRTKDNVHAVTYCVPCCFKPQVNHNV